MRENQSKDLFVQLEAKEIIFECNTQLEIDKAEIDFIRENKVLENKDKWYNIDCGGQYGRHENHAKIVSKVLKCFYQKQSSLTKLIKGKNKARIAKGINPLPYNNYNEYVSYKNNYKIFPKIIIANRRKLIKIKRLKSNSAKSVRMLYDYRRDISIKAQQASMNKMSLYKRRQSQRKAWDKRKADIKDNWTIEAKKSFCVGKLKLSNNYAGLYLLECGLNNVKKYGIGKKIKRAMNDYKDESNYNKQLDNIIITIKKHYNILINKDVLHNRIQLSKCNAIN